MKTINIKKFLIGCLATILLFASCCTGKKTPENTLAVFEIDGEINYLQYVELDNEIEPTANGDFYLNYSFIWGNYPRCYNAGSAILHIIPEDNMYKIETQYISGGTYKKDKPVETDWGTGEFQFVGYSTDENLLEAKILEYYLENKDDFDK